jgi:hypothetical protein
VGHGLRYELFGSIEQPDFPGSLRLLANALDDEDREGENTEPHLDEDAQQTHHRA